MTARYRADDEDMRAAGRTPESFVYVVVELWAGTETDRIYTDDKADALVIAGKMLEEAYDVLIVDQAPSNYVAHPLALDPVNLA